MNLAENPPDPNAVVLITKEIASKRVCVAVKREMNLLTVGMADPLLFSLVQARPVFSCWAPSPLSARPREAVAALEGHGGKAAASLLLIPVDIRDWSAQVPADAPRICRAVLEKLKQPS